MLAITPAYPSARSTSLLRRLLFAAARLVSPSAVERDRRFREIMSVHAALVERICFSFAGSETEYADMRQEAWINIWRGLDSRREESKLSTWIYRVTFNSCISALRSRALKGAVSLDFVADVIAADPVSRAEVEYLHSLIACLPAQDKAIIIMWLDEHTYDEIAQVTGLPRNTVATRLRRIKEKIVNLHHKLS